MARGFSEREKNIIYKLLLEKGRELFEHYGLKKTRIKDLTDAVGIAQGSFYNFFGSKEELYFKLLEEEEEKIKIELLTKLSNPENFSLDELKDLLVSGLLTVKDNRLLKQIYIKGEYEKLIRKLPEEWIKQHIKRDESTLFSLIENLQKRGIMLKEDPEVITGIIRGVFLLTLHKKEIGEEIFDRVIQLLIEFVIKGLTKEGQNSDKGKES